MDDGEGLVSLPDIELPWLGKDGPRLDAGNLFLLACREACRSGKPTPEEAKLLQSLASALKIPPEQATKAFDLARREKDQGKLEAGAKLDMARLFDKACKLAMTDGKVDPVEQVLLERFGRALGLDPEAVRVRAYAIGGKVASELVVPEPPAAGGTKVNRTGSSPAIVGAAPVARTGSNPAVQGDARPGSPSAPRPAVGASRPVPAARTGTGPAVGGAASDRPSPAQLIFLSLGTILIVMNVAGIWVNWAAILEGGLEGMIQALVGVMLAVGVAKSLRTAAPGPRWGAIAAGVAMLVGVGLHLRPHPMAVWTERFKELAIKVGDTTRAKDFAAAERALEQMMAHAKTMPERRGREMAVAIVHYRYADTLTYQTVVDEKRFADPKVMHDHIARVREEFDTCLDTLVRENGPEVPLFNQIRDQYANLLAQVGDKTRESEVRALRINPSR